MQYFAYSQLIYYGSDYMAIASNVLQKVVQIVVRKRKIVESKYTNG